MACPTIIGTKPNMQINSAGKLVQLLALEVVVTLI